MGDTRTPAKVAGFATLDVAEIQMQTQPGSRMSVGNDSSRPGDHTRLFIQDDTQCRALSDYADTTDDVLVLNADSVRELLVIREKDEFSACLEALVTNDTEKKMIAQIAEENSGNDIATWEMDAVNKLAEPVIL